MQHRLPTSVLRSATTHGCELTDRELIDRFLGSNDETAFASLVARYGPMVLRLCRRVLHNAHDAEDAFQAVFLVLARRAGSLARRETLGGWLHRVAYRAAQKMRIAAARRGARERQTTAPPAADPLDQLTVREAQGLIDQELLRLPDKFRVPLVLCYLDGLTRDEAARRLGWAPALLKTRLEQARERLGRRLSARGLAPAAALSVVLIAESAPAAVPRILFDSTVRTATVVAAGGSAASAVPARVAELSMGVITAMSTTKLKTAAALLLALVGLGAAAVLARENPADPPPQRPAPPAATAPVAEGKPPVADDGLRQQIQKWTWRVTAVADGGKAVTLQRVAQPAGFDLQLEVDPAAVVVLDGREVKPAALPKFAEVSVVLAKDKPVITRIEGTRSDRIVLKRFDKDKNALTVVAAGKEWTAPLAKNATVRMSGPNGGKPNAGPADLKEGMLLSLVQFGAEGGTLVVTGVHTNGQIVALDR